MTSLVNGARLEAVASFAATAAAVNVRIGTSFVLAPGETALLLHPPCT